jgi:radical SAM enzyme (TIGR01210 family)
VLVTATVFLTGRECAWRCVMCDLWRFTTAGDTPVGAIPTQVRDAAEGLRAQGVRPDVWKLYNASSFFDRRAVPPADDHAIADIVGGAARVVVESHPSLVGDRVWRFRDRLARFGTALEVAMGLETVHPEALAAINKGVRLAAFEAAAQAVRQEGIAWRAFLLVHPPFVPVCERRQWLQRSVTFARDGGATAVALIPTRSGEGAMRALTAEGSFVAPTIGDLEQASADGLMTPGVRVFADLWDLNQHSRCPRCLERRRARLARQNLEQRVAAPYECRECEERPPS